MDEQWKETRREVNRGGRLILLWVIITVVVAGALGTAAWAIGVASSGPRGQGDAYAEKNSAENWTGAQARFEDLYADIKATDLKIDVADELLAANPDDKTYQQTLAGTKSYCLEVVGDYNAEARKYLAKDFRAADLPHQIDDLDPTTDCKENTP